MKKGFSIRDEDDFYIFLLSYWSQMGEKMAFAGTFLIILLLMEVDEIHPTHQLDHITILIRFHSISSISRQDFVS